MTSPRQLLIAALREAGIDAYDGEPTTTPPGRYVACWGGSGLRRPDSYAGKSRNATTTFTVMCVARTADGLDALVAEVASILTDRRLAGRESSPLTEGFASPRLSGGPEGDVRLTTNLTYTATFPRQGEQPHD